MGGETVVVLFGAQLLFLASKSMTCTIDLLTKKKFAWAVFGEIFWRHLRCSHRSLHHDWLWESLLSNWILMHFLTPSTLPFCHIRCPCWRFLICVIWLFGWIWRGWLEWVPSWGWWQPFPGALEASWFSSFQWVFRFLIFFMIQAFCLSVCLPVSR